VGGEAATQTFAPGGKYPRAATMVIAMVSLTIALLQIY